MNADKKSKNEACQSREDFYRRNIRRCAENLALTEDIIRQVERGSGLKTSVPQIRIPATLKAKTRLCEIPLEGAFISRFAGTEETPKA